MFGYRRIYAGGDAKRSEGWETLANNHSRHLLNILYMRTIYLQFYQSTVKQPLAKIARDEFAGAKRVKRVTSLRGPSPRHSACRRHSSFQQMSQRWRAVGNTVSYLTGSRFEPQIPRSINKHVTTRAAYKH